MHRRLQWPGAEMGFFKIAATDGMLPRETCLHNGLVPTAGSDWLLTWSGGSLRDSTIFNHYKNQILLLNENAKLLVAMCKGNFQGLAEQQKINHFPGGCELTRKDRYTSSTYS